MPTKGPMPRVEYDGANFTVRSRKTVIPDLAAMDRYAALQWLIVNTYQTGYSRQSRLVGFGGALAVSSR